MGAQYSEDQKTLIMLFGDLLEGPLASCEKETLAAALEDAQGDVARALEHVDSALAAKANDLLSQGIRLSNELQGLRQRGVSVVFAHDMESSVLLDVFEHRPQLLFVVGDKTLLAAAEPHVETSAQAFKESGCRGILVADRAMDALLGDAQIFSALRESCMLLVSDGIHAAAHVRSRRVSDRVDEQRPQGQAKRVFISGSRAQSEIPANVQKSLNAVIHQGFNILIGDSERGVDKEIIDYLRAPLYPHVTVFTIADQPRVAVEPAWRVQRVEADPSLKPQQRQMEKDRAMARMADWGLAVFNPIQKNRYGSLQVSSGTLRNTIQLLLQGGAVKLFYLYEGEMRVARIKTFADLESVVESYRNEHLNSGERNTILSSKGISTDDAAFEKYQRIAKKYRQLRRSEEKIFAARGGDDAGGGTNGAGQMALPLFNE